MSEYVCKRPLEAIHLKAAEASFQQATLTVVVEMSPRLSSAVFL